jgi:hypothetical protein
LKNRQCAAIGLYPTAAKAAAAAVASLTKQRTPTLSTGGRALRSPGPANNQVIADCEFTH